MPDIPVNQPDDPPLLSIVTGTRNRPASYKRFIDSIFANTTLPFEVVVADASDDPVYVTEYSQGAGCVRVIQERPRIGPMRGYNLAFRQCRGTWVAWFNDDVEVLPLWDTAAVTFLNVHPEVGIGCVYFRDHLGKNGWSTRFGTQSLYGLPYANFGVLRRELGDRIGWFDETLGWMYGNDTDLSFAAIKLKKAVVPIPGCRVMHWRERDELRSDNRDRASNDRSLFDKKWVPQVKALRMEHSRFDNIKQPQFCS